MTDRSDNDLSDLLSVGPNRLAILTQYTRNSVLITDRGGQIRWVNDSFVRSTGYSKEEAIGRKPGDLLQGTGTDPGTITRMRDGLARGEGFDEEVLNYTRDGDPIWFRINCSPLDRDDCGHDGFIAIQNDITRLKESQRELRIAASVFERSHDAIMITDQNNRIIDINPAFSRITGYGKAEVMGRSPAVLSSGQHSREFYQAMWGAIERRHSWRGEITNRRKNGELFTELVSINRVQLDHPDEWYHVAVFSDITALKNHAEAMDRVANYDDLTGLPNQRLLTSRMYRALAEADRSGTALAVMQLDLDQFKQINDRFGHAAGDHVLATIAKRLKAAVRKEDTLARLSGDEFVLLLPDLEDDLEACQRLLAQVRGPVAVGPTTVSITASAGVTFYPEDTSEPDRLIRHAGQAMYLVKENGGDGCHRFDPGVIRHRELRLQMLGELSEAIRQDQLELHYQPQVQMADNAVIGAEALIRWRHPRRGLLSPGEFLPVVTGSELEVPMGQWVIRNALAQLDAWQQAGLNLQVSINISANHLMDPGFTDYLRSHLLDHPEMDPAMVTLEVLESTALDDMQRAGNVIGECRGMGFQVALDDFGTGYSSLTYFRALPIDLIKIDQSFIRNMMADTSDRAIVESVIFLAKQFRRPVLAEGVETLDHADVLRQMGCEQIQGYGIAKPLPAADFLHWLRDWRQRYPTPPQRR
ncbi:EAL domain-containing protein [Marinobacter sp. CA1]|uniref:sensor domain-containing protein n=1 Tax=Marinobacter sp. CA1 TaxID=2817656 RepID=UPI001D062BCD|nr:EAL domain-containing protein [Marinobacter sp. CA1]UDL05299.1 EAL domain-containing protein [Marinobacter sp. CA1]